MATGLMCGRREILLLLRSQRQFHRVAGPSHWPQKPLTSRLPFPAGQNYGRPHYVLAAAGPRCLSTSAVSFAEAQVQASPPAVPVTPSPTAVTEVAPGETADVVQAAAEQSFAELGLGSYTPVGLIQNLLEFMHVDLGLPWWGAIAASTVLARCLVFPLIIKGQKEAAKIHNHLPEIQKFSTRIREAKLAGDQAEFYRACSEMTLYQKKHDVKLFRPLILPLTQLGAETGVQSSDLQWMRNVIRVMPLAVLPITIHFPSVGNGTGAGSKSFHMALLLPSKLTRDATSEYLLFVLTQAVFMYWLSSNMFSLGQVACLRIPAVRTVLKIPQRVVHDPDKLAPREGFVKSFKRGWRNAEIAHQMQERERRMQNHLQLAARGPLRQTFAHNPLLQPGKNHPSTTPDSSSKPKSKQPWQDTLG
ncbi:mitochondrial inner membrane protein OXA1L isoform X3 [Trichechus manatus latirostris]|uniref:Mitochondrial inner membrane protein OXA1L isoform X3 n=1 Tax=Trichechus manatus latirostris TaxID=127582 RepID=A0A2Y9QBW8_TRIMA|nr:mitochondrial inner membrane protein OXA1L isoform X3 [Trichechus manatus latirostris]